MTKRKLEVKHHQHILNLLALFVFVLLLIWLCGLAETTMWVSYGNWMTAGEIFAFVTANKYESSDVLNYCLRYVWPYWVVCSLIYLGIGVLVWWLTVIKNTRPAHYTAIGIIVFLAVPFFLPGVANSLAHEIACVVRQVRNIEKLQNDNDSFRYNSVRQEPVAGKEIYVLSLGESVRYKNLSLSGTYNRETTPLLGKQTELVLYSDYYANATLTQHALPMLLTDVACNNFVQHFNRKTIAAAFQEAGFTTVLISHRAQLMNNGYHNYLAKDFDTLIFVKHDSLIAPELANFAKKNEKLFAVTHYLGNHMFYTNRTEDCLVWRPDYNADPKAKSDSLFLNAYDNSLLYTDRLLNKEIETLKQTKEICAWLFVSDHGEYISPKVSGHGHTYHPTKEEYHVPLMVWYSDEYKEAYPEKVANLIKHKDEPVCADHVFWSVLDMAGIRIDSALQQDGMSVFSNTLLPHTRTLLLPDGKSVMTLD